MALKRLLTKRKKIINMCGLVGVIAKHTMWKAHTDMFHELLYVDNFRGRDSTGVFMVDKDGDLEVIKEASCSPDFQRTLEYETIMKNAYARGRAVIGHNRAATKGTVNDENAHPFIVDNRIILVHNGTLFGDYKKLAGEGNEVEVDSHAIAHLIHKHGDNVEAALQEVNGAFALIWFDMENQTLNFVRNSQRPLYWLETNDCYMWASEKNFLDWMVSRHNLTNAKIAQLAEGVLCTIKFHKNNVELTNKKISFTKPHVAGPSTMGPSLPWESDMCGNPMDMQAANGYCLSEDGEWEEYFASRNSTESNITELNALSRALQKQEAAKQARTQYEEASARIVQGARAHEKKLEETKQMRTEETRWAAERHCQVTITGWNSDHGNFKDSNRYRVKCFNYTYINGKDGTGGYYLYGILAGVTQYLVRCAVSEEIPELMLVDLTTNKKDASVCITGRCWRSFENRDWATANGDGFGLFLANNPKRILVDPPTGSRVADVEVKEIR